MKYPTEKLSLEYRTIGDIIKGHPDTSEIVKKYFGQDCLKGASLEIQTLEMACILFGVDRMRVLREFEKIQY